MAKIIKQFEYKNIGATKPGELVRIALKGKPAFCININAEQPTDNHVRLGILRWDEADKPIWFKSESGSHCLSFGHDWIIDYSFGEESSARRDGTSGDQQILLIAGDKALLRFDPPAKGGFEIDSILVDISAGTEVNHSDTQKNVPFARWRIWASEADLDNARKQPLIAFG